MRPLLPASEIQSNEAQLKRVTADSNQFARRKAFGKRRVALIISEATG